MKKNIFNIPFTHSYLDVIAKALIEETKEAKENLASYLLITPNKRIIKNLQDAFLRSTNGAPIILPQMLSLQDLTYVITSKPFINSSLYNSKQFQGIFKKTISKRQRSFILAKLIVKKDHTLSINQAIFMAESLGNIIDDAYLQNIDFKNLDKVVDVNLAKYWQETLKFLEIATDSYPSILNDLNMIDESHRQKLIYELNTTLWQNTPPLFPVIALNVVSYYDSIINMVKTISSLKNGKAIFYGIDEKTTNDIKYQHPQKMLNYMLDKMQINKNNIKPFYKDTSNKNHIIKEQFIHRLFDTNIYKPFTKKEIATLTKDLHLITTKNEEEEAKTLALIIRETIETPTKTIGLIINNKSLANRLINELQRWNIEVNDYMGNSLYDSLNARFFILIGRLFSEGFEPYTFLSLLKHPFSCFGKSRKETIRIMEILDLKVLRTPINTFSINEIIKLTKENINNPKEKAQVLSFLNHLKELLNPLKKIINNPNQTHTVKELLIKHIEFAEQLSLSANDNNNNNELWSNQEGRLLSLLLSELIEDGTYLQDKISIPEYLGIIELAIQKTTTRQIYNTHPRIYLYGSLQSNLVQHDVMVISNLNDTSMPMLPAPNPWLNAYINKTLGFLPKEKLLGEQSNIFCQILGAKEVILTRSEKEEGVLKAPSRWLLKLVTFLEYYKIKELNGKNYLYVLQSSLDLPKSYNTNSITKPSFSANINRRPKTIAATKLELLYQNPYIFFIDRILKLKPINAINENVVGKILGTKIHSILETFFSRYKDYQLLSLEEQINQINEIFEGSFNTISNTINFEVFTKPLMISGLHKLLQRHFNTFPKIKTMFLETEGLTTYKVADQEIIITGKADRIDILDSEVIITDYKTSKTKTEPYHKQLFVLASILKNNGFKDIQIQNHHINAQYIFLPKKIQDDVAIKTIYTMHANKKETITFDEIIKNYEEDLLKTLSSYYKDLIPYEFSNNKNIYKEYLHFARFDEWNTSIDNLIKDEEEDVEE